MKSHPLPGPVIEDVTDFVRLLDDALQLGVHSVDVAEAEHPGFEARWVRTTLVRSVIWDAAVRVDALLVDDLGNGGVELVHQYRVVERRFRLKLGHLDRYGEIQVRVGSDSLLTTTARAQSLFEYLDGTMPAPEVCERWVLAYTLDPRTSTFAHVIVGRGVALDGNRPPFRLVLADRMTIDHTVPTPPSFGAANDDLDLPDDLADDGTDEELGS